MGLHRSVAGLGAFTHRTQNCEEEKRPLPSQVQRLGPTDVTGRGQVNRRKGLFWMSVGASQRGRENPEVVRPRSSQPLTKGDALQRRDQTKEGGLGSWGRKMREGQHMGKRGEDGGSCRFRPVLSSVTSVISAHCLLFLGQEQEPTLQMEVDVTS